MLIRFLKLWAVYMLPVFLFDGCLNKDPAYYLDDKARLIAPWATAPLSLSYRGNNSPSSSSFQLPDITEFLMSEEVFTGKTGNDFFIVRRSDGRKLIFPSADERDVVLKKAFSLKLHQLRPIPWDASIKANFLYPYNLMYYAATLAGCLAYVWIIRRNTAGGGDLSGP